MSDKGYSDLLASILSEHAQLVAKIRKEERAGRSVPSLHWVAWHMIQLGELIQGHIDKVVTLDNNEFYKAAAMLQDCINFGRKGS